MGFDLFKTSAMNSLLSFAIHLNQFMFATVEVEAINSTTCSLIYGFFSQSYLNRFIYDSLLVSKSKLWQYHLEIIIMK